MNIIANDYPMRYLLAYASVVVFYYNQINTYEAQGTSTSEPIVQEIRTNEHKSERRSDRISSSICISRRYLL
jgi:hypothetical protein